MGLVCVKVGAIFALLKRIVSDGSAKGNGNGNASLVVSHGIFFLF
jgi:hypothetical protein